MNDSIIHFFRGLETSKLNENLDGSYTNSLCQSTDILSTEDRSKFILSQAIAVYPKIISCSNRTCILGNPSTYTQRESKDLCKNYNGQSGP
jgi:hypothetical protein